MKYRIRKRKTPPSFEGAVVGAITGAMILMLSGAAVGYLFRELFTPQAITVRQAGISLAAQTRSMMQTTQPLELGIYLAFTGLCLGGCLGGLLGIIFRDLNRAVSRRTIVLSVILTLVLIPSAFLLLIKLT
jgi:hypothetical protein